MKWAENEAFSYEMRHFEIPNGAFQAAKCDVLQRETADFKCAETAGKASQTAVSAYQSDAHKPMRKP